MDSPHLIPATHTGVSPFPKQNIPRLIFAMTISAGMHAILLSFNVDSGVSHCLGCTPPMMEVKLSRKAKPGEDYLQQEVKPKAKRKIGSDTPTAAKAPPPTPPADEEARTLPLITKNPEDDEPPELPECVDSFGEVILGLKMGEDGQPAVTTVQGNNASKICIERLVTEFLEERLGPSAQEIRERKIKEIILDLGPPRILLPLN